MNPEQKKLTVVVVLFLVAGGVGWYFWRSGDPLSDSVKFVCVATGKTYTIGRGEMPDVVPAENPDTHEFTLLPLSKNEAGELVINARFANELRHTPTLAKVNRYVDPNTCKVLDTPRDAAR